MTKGRAPGDGDCRHLCTVSDYDRPGSRRHPGFAVGGGVELAHQPVVIKDRQCEVPPPALGGWLVHLQLVVEFEQLDGALAVMDEPVERRQQCRAPRHQICARRDDHGRVDLEQCQAARHLQQPAWPPIIEQLRAHRDAACVAS